MSCKKYALPIAVACTMFAMAAPASAAPTTLQSANNPSGNQAYSGVGLVFHVNSAINVTSIGIYDSDLDGISRQAILSAYLFDATNAIVASETFTNSTPGTLDGGYLFKSMSPLTLAVGDYTLMGYGWITSDMEHNCNIGGICENFDTGGGLVSYITSGWTASGNDSPGTLPINFGTTNYFSSANLKFEAADGRVPEPATLGLLALAFGGLGWMRRKSV